MNCNDIRKSFCDFFESKLHKIVPSAPMVVKNDSTLMFTNAGMNQFKDLFLGNAVVKYPRIADSQKCLRVSGKHNDLEEVGHDTYHHTMFEMLGNWSFGDYFKKNAIEWAWEFLVDVLKIDKNRLYATIFEGNEAENIPCDEEAKNYWLQFLPQERILLGSKKDNFWEMGDTGPCGPCSEIHVDIRNDEEREKTNGKELVNKSHPHVIEIWNLVFIQFNRKMDGSLESLPAKHVDTGMGFERLCMVVQGKQSNYDTDVFQPLIHSIAKLANRKYGDEKSADIAMRVISDHLRAVSFAIADGQMPSNAKAGYVIRRILRRAVRYGYTFLNFNEPFIYKLVEELKNSMGNAYPELISQQTLIEKVIFEEETAFLRTLERGIKLLDEIMKETKAKNESEICGKDAFKLYDTFGFPFDLTELILRENNLSVNKTEFDEAMLVQKNTSKTAAEVETQDWVILSENESGKFVGYDTLEAEIIITRYRKVSGKGKNLFQLVFDHTPFYAESGGQMGDTGIIESESETLEIVDTRKENDLIIHFAENLPQNPNSVFKAKVDSQKRQQTQNNHSATHLLHFALRQVLGTMVEQKGSLVSPSHLRFDFSYFQKVNDEELLRIEKIVNELIRKNISLKEHRNIPLNEATKMGAMALFGEKYGETVRMIQFENSVELCGGTHVCATGQIGFFKILSEGSISAGIRRIEAVTADGAENFVNETLETLNNISKLFKNSKNMVASVQNLIEENSVLRKELKNIEKEKVLFLKNEILNNISHLKDFNFVVEKVSLTSADALKDLVFQMKQQMENLFAVLFSEVEEKVLVAIILSDSLIKSKNINATQVFKEFAAEIEAKGGGQPFFVQASGTRKEGIATAMQKIKNFVNNL